MRHIDSIEITIKGIALKPQKFLIPAEFKNEVYEFYNRFAFDKEDTVSAEEAFPESFDPTTGPGRYLHGIRLREALTQKELAEKLGIRQHHLSEMENGKRPIGKEMARKLAKILRCSYRVFL